MVLIKSMNYSGYLYIFNLRGGVRGKSKHLAILEGGNIFNIMTGVAISIMVKDGSDNHEIKYFETPDKLSGTFKLNLIKELGTIHNIDWNNITPDKYNDWIKQRDVNYKIYPAMEGDLFYNKFIGIQTKRDSWVYSFKKDNAFKNSEELIKNFNNYIDTTEISNNQKEIKWSDDLKRLINKKQKITLPNRDNLILVQYRPFTKKWLYFQKEIISRPGKGMEYYEVSNSYINLNGTSARKEFGTLITNLVPDANMMDAGTQSFPLYLADGNININNKIIKNISNIEEQDIMPYIYSVLHSDEYRIRYQNDLGKELPRIPNLKNKRKYIEIGRELVECHLNYENQASWNGVEVVTSISNPSYKVTKMKHPKKGVLDTIIYNEHITIKNIPEKAYEYVVNGRPAIEWIIDQYRVKTDKKSGIADDPNEYSDDPKYILNLLLSIITVSMRTLELIEELPEFEVIE
ncbi:TPA: type ISP restriction/modification enzyme [Enterococcus faecium]